MTGWWMLVASQCLGAVVKVKVATTASTGIPVILCAPRPCVHCTTLPSLRTDCAVLRHVLSVHAHHASC
jgi:hypothetical protein